MEGYITEELYCPLFYKQVQETQAEPTCLLKKNQNNQNPETSGLLSLFFVFTLTYLANADML